jgi:hypothetical protein
MLLGMAANCLDGYSEKTNRMPYISYVGRNELVAFINMPQTESGYRVARKHLATLKQVGAITEIKPARNGKRAEYRINGLEPDYQYPPEPDYQYPPKEDYQYPPKAVHQYPPYRRYTKEPLEPLTEGTPGAQDATPLSNAHRKGEHQKQRVIGCEICLVELTENNQPKQ